MSRFARHADIGLRWMRCGWRLFQRNPWLLGGMGFCCSTVVTVLMLIPFAGAPLTGLVIPVFLAGMYFALETTAKQKLRLPAKLRFAALKQAPRELVIVFRDESRTMLALVLSLYCMIVVVLGLVLMWAVLGTAIANRGEFGWLDLPRVIVAALVVLSIYALLAASLIYTVPLAFLEREPVVPAMTRGVKAAARYVYALLVLFGFLLAPVVLNGLAGLFSHAVGRLLGLIAGTIVIPVVAAALYCSYRTVFAAAEPQADSTPIAEPKVVAMTPRRR